MTHTRQLEFVPAVFLILWGVWVMNPFWDTFVVSGSYALMAKLAPEWLWGAVFLFIGIVQMFALFTPRLKLRLYTSFSSILILSTLAIFSGVGNYRSTGMIGAISIAVCEWFAYTELLAEIKGKVFGIKGKSNEHKS
jgi:hypothetical protein